MWIFWRILIYGNCKGQVPFRSPLLCSFCASVCSTVKWAEHFQWTGWSGSRWTGNHLGKVTCSTPCPRVHTTFQQHSPNPTEENYQAFCSVTPSGPAWPWQQLRPRFEPHSCLGHAGGPTIIRQTALMFPSSLQAFIILIYCELSQSWSLLQGTPCMETGQCGRLPLPLWAAHSHIMTSTRCPLGTGTYPFWLPLFSDQRSADFL
jgi:hypothetical protein